MNKNLGRGLSELLKDESPMIEGTTSIKLVELVDLELGEYQPRKHFDYDKLKELADSITSSGLLQPIIVTLKSNGKYQIIAGERRWRACKIAGLREVPVIVKGLEDREKLEIALIENIQREQLSVIEEAEGFERLIKEFNYSQEQLAKILGKSRSHISNLLRLNNLSQKIKDLVNAQQLTMGHSRCLIGHEQAETIADYIIENELSVRETENLVKNWHKKHYSKSPQDKSNIRQLSSDDRDNELKMLVSALSEKFGMRISIESYPIGGKLVFHYNDLEQLDNILSRLDT